MQNNVNENLKPVRIQRSLTELQLDAKDADLVLAAKLGQTLLEQNEELTSENNRLLRKIEVLQQENFVLKRDLQVVEDCNNSLIDDLKAEILGLQDSLSKQGIKQQASVWENSNLDRELKDQNQRLSKQLVEAGERESELRRAMHSLREKVNRERRTLEDHFSYIESLKGEISLTLDNKAELEKHVNELVHEKDSLSDSLEYSVGKIFSLEKRQRDQENLLRSSERELEELKSSNQFLIEKLETSSFSRSSSQSRSTSIMSELALSTSDNDMSLHRCKSFDIIHEADEDLEEYDEDTLVVETESSQLNEEVMIACQKLQQLCDKIKGSTLERSDISDILTIDVQKYQLKSISEELERLILENLSVSNQSVSVSCQTSTRCDQQEQDLKFDMEKKNREVERLIIKLKEAEVDILKKDMIIEGISEKLQVLQARLCQVENCRNNSEGCLNNWMNKYEQKMAQLGKERQKNTTKTNDEPRSTTSLVPAPPSPSQSCLYKKLHQLEDQVKEILANNDTSKKQTAKAVYVNNYVTKKLGGNDSEKKPLSRR